MHRVKSAIVFHDLYENAVEEPFRIESGKNKGSFQVLSFCMGKRQYHYFRRIDDAVEALLNLVNAEIKVKVGGKRKTFLRPLDPGDDILIIRVDHNWPSRFRKRLLDRPHVKSTNDWDMDGYRATGKYEHYWSKGLLVGPISEYEEIKATFQPEFRVARREHLKSLKKTGLRERVLLARGSKCDICEVHHAHLMEVVEVPRGNNNIDEKVELVFCANHHRGLAMKLFSLKWTKGKLTVRAPCYIKDALNIWIDEIDLEPREINEI